MYRAICRLATFVLLTFIACADETSSPTLPSLTHALSASIPQDSPEDLLDVSVGLLCQEGDCEDFQADHQVVEPGDPSRAIRGYDNVRMQAEREDDFRVATARALELASDCTNSPTSEDALVLLTVYLREQPFDFRRYRSATGALVRDARRALTHERREQLRPVQDRVEAHLAGLGGEIRGRRVLANIVDVAVPACAIPALVESPDVVGVEIPGRTGNGAVDGIERRSAVGLPPYGITGLDGGNGSLRSGGARVRFGVIDSDSNLNITHLSFRDGTGTALRIVDTDSCDFWFPSNRCINTANTTVSTHGTKVTSVLLSDLADGQDSAITNATQRHLRSGIAPEAAVHYYNANSGQAFAAVAVDEAASEDGVDVINLSIFPKDDTMCDNVSNDGMREEIEAATDAGVVVVAITQNQGQLSGCNVSNYATYPDSLAVGSTTEATSVYTLDAVNRASSSSWGSIDVTLNGGSVVATPLVDVVTNDCHELMAGGGTNTYTSDCGTSVAAPTISGLVGLLLNWSFNRGGLSGLQSDPYAIQALILLMGDGRGGGGVEQNWRVDPQLGFGNVRFTNLDSDLGANGGWNLSRTVVLPGSMHELSVGTSAKESSTLNGFKYVALIDRNRYGDSPDVTFQLVDKCPAGGGGEAVLVAATKHALKARIRISQSQLNTMLRDRCLWIRTTVNHAAAAFTLYTAYMYYNSPRVGQDSSLN